MANISTQGGAAAATAPASLGVSMEKISFREKFCYGLGDTSFNIFMGITMMLLTVFYTDVFKLDPATMGTLFLISRFIDAVSDPLCGMISDRTKSRFGRYRSWLLYFSVPYGVSCAAVFLCPDLSDTGKTIYAYVTYMFLVLSFTCVVVPYVSLLGAISANSDERLSINAIRFPLTKVAYIICSLIVPGLLALFDNEVIGYRVVMTGIGILCIVLLWVCFANTKERVNDPVDDSISFGTQLKLMLKNDQAGIVFGGQVLVMISNTLNYGAAAYFVKYVLESSTGALSAVLTAGSIAGILAPFAANYLLQNGYIKRMPLFVVSQLVRVLTNCKYEILKVNMWMACLGSKRIGDPPMTYSPSARDFSAGISRVVENAPSLICSALTQVTAAAPCTVLSSSGVISWPGVHASLGRMKTYTPCSAPSPT